MKKKTLADLKAEAAAFTEQWIAQQTPDVLKAKLKRELNSVLCEVLAQMLGFEHRYGRWEIDHCNGRMSHMTKLLTDNAREAVSAYLKDAVKVLPPLTTTQKGAIKKAYSDQVQYELQDRAKYLGRNNAEALWRTVVKDLGIEEPDL